MPIRLDTGDSLVVSGYWGGTGHIVGRKFTSHAKFPRVFPGLATNAVNAVVIYTFHERTTDYVVRLIRDGRDTDKQYQFTSKVVGDVRHGEAPIETGMFEVDGGGEGRSLQIQVESTTSGPFRLGAMVIDLEIGAH